MLDRARSAFLPKEYDCLGCPVCFPALAINAFTEAFPEADMNAGACPTEASPERRGWPPLPGDYHLVRFDSPVAVCTLNSGGLATRLAREAPAGLAIAGTLRTENLGIERIIRNVLANPNIRFLVLCGRDTRQAVGHLPGQSLRSLFEGGVDERGRIRGARGKRAILSNVGRHQVEAFLHQVELSDLVGEEKDVPILETIRHGVARDPGPVDGASVHDYMMTVAARASCRVVLDPAGFFVIYADRARSRLVAEHYRSNGAIDCVVAGETPSAVCDEVIRRDLVSRLDHAAYLGRELTRAWQSLQTGEPYVQDRASGA